MLTENKFSKYLLYAIGEILLVVIGILIALNINNWNETQKEKVKATIILEAIRSDMVKDLKRIEILKVFWGKEIRYFKRVFPSFNPHKDIDSFAGINTISRISYPTLFQHGPPFRSNTSTFDAMIAEGNSDLITNDTLFSNIQNFYTFNVPTNQNLIEIMRQRSSDLCYKYAHIITYKPYKNINDLTTDENLIADLNIYFQSKNFYYGRIFFKDKESLIDIIAQIDKELVK